MGKAMALESMEKRVEKLNIPLTFGEDACFLLYSLCIQLITRPNMQSILSNISDIFFIREKKKD